MDTLQALPRGSTLSALFLVAGTCIGGGMLALPLATGISGFLPSLAIMLFCWIAMTVTALLLLEVSLWMEEGAHVITMTSRILGLPGKAISWVLYLFICYTSLVGYTAGGGLQISAAFQNYFHLPVSKDLGCVIFFFLFGALIYLGSQVVGRINSILFMGMILAYLALVTMGLDEVHPEKLMHRQWTGSWLAIPLLLTTFSFQTMVPSLTPYLKRHVKPLRIAIIGGTSLTFVVYALWQWLILGIVPVEGSQGLAEALKLGIPPTQFVREHVYGFWISEFAEFFAFFAIATSFLGIALGLFDFLSDGLRIKEQGLGKIVIAGLIAIPTLVFSTQLERIFVVAMEISGGFGDSILNGIFPVLMVWIGRYRLGYTGPYRMAGGKPILVAVFCFFSIALIIEVLMHLGLISSMYSIYDELKFSDINSIID